MRSWRSPAARRPTRSPPGPRLFTPWLVLLAVGERVTEGRVIVLMFSARTPRMPTTGALRGLPPIEPRNGASKAKIPPSEATSQ